MPDERYPERDGGAPPPDDETRPLHAVDGADDATRVQPDRPRSGDTPTAETRPLSPVGGWDPDPGEADDALWTGRASVRPPGPERTGYTNGDAPEEEPSGRWWMPIVVGIVGLLLLGLLGYGIYLIVQNSGSGGETPQPTPARSRATATTAPITRPTTEPAPSTAPTTEPATTEATVPALRGMPLEDARAALERSGLEYRIIELPSDAEPGTVIDCDPAEGQVVPPDTRITLVVAAERTGGPAPTTTAPTGDTGTEPGED
ncbi:PASTA domain-containing protein [Actinoplanes siamensis]|nr:PASTA domain-containing protein [Actinoplanes siamensis]